jgi:hypothetical protein
MTILNMSMIERTKTTMINKQKMSTNTMPRWTRKTLLISEW